MAAIKPFRGVGQSGSMCDTRSVTSEVLIEHNGVGVNEEAWRAGRKNVVRIIHEMEFNRTQKGNSEILCTNQHI